MISDADFLLKQNADDVDFVSRPDGTDLGGSCITMPCCSEARLMPEFCCIAEMFPDITNRLCTDSC